MGGLSCKKAEAMIDELLDDQLPEPAREVLEIHLECCDSCRGYRDAARYTLDALAGQPLSPPSQRSLDRMWNGLHEKIEKTDKKPRIEAFPACKESPMNPWRFVAGGAGIAALAAGILLLVWIAPWSSSNEQGSSPITQSVAIREEINDTPAGLHEQERVPSHPSLILVDGQAERENAQGLSPTSLGTEVRLGESFAVPAGALARLNRGSDVQFSFGPGSRFVISQHTEDSIHIQISGGWLAGRVAPNASLEVNVATPVGELYVIERVFAVEVIRDRAVEVRVLEGEAAFRPHEAEAPQIVTAGRTVVFPENATDELTSHRRERDLALLEGHLATITQRRQSAPPSLEELFEQAERARRQGRSRQAATLYQQIASADRRGGAGGNALMSLGQLYLGPLHQPERARRAFSSYLASRRRSLRQEAYVGLIRSQRVLGQSTAARQTARRYLEEYPRGRYRRVAEGL